MLLLKVLIAFVYVFVYQDCNGVKSREQEITSNTRQRFPQSVLKREAELKAQQAKDAELKKAAQKPKVYINKSKASHYGS